MKKIGLLKEVLLFRRLCGTYSELENLGPATRAHTRAHARARTHAAAHVFGNLMP